MRRFSLVLAAVVLLGGHAAAQTRLLRFPDISGAQLVFVYGGDLWLAPVAGGTARRLTAGPGLELFPKFSPDGQSVAFTGQYGGDEQVYVIPIQGGEPRQLTFYPAEGPLAERWGYDHQVYGWTPDGERVLFRSLRDGYSLVGSRLYTVPASGGLPQALPMPTAGAGAFSPDGRRIVYSPLFRDFRTWKRYEGGWAQDLYIFDLDQPGSRNITNQVRTDRDPMWFGGKIYFASDRDDYLNIYSYDPSTRQTRQLTHHRDGDAIWASDDGDHRIVYEFEGGLRILDVASGRDTAVSITVGDDTVTDRPQTIQVSDFVEDFDVSPRAERVAMTARGEVFSVPVEHGITRNLTATPGAHEREAAWSPQGDRIAYISDATGEEELYVRDASGSRAPVQITEESHTRYYGPLWSPDRGRIAFRDAAARIYVADVERRRVAQVADDAGFGVDDYAWSPDGRWLAYSTEDPNGYRSLYVWDARGRQSHRLTDATFNEFSAAFSPDGKYLYFLSDRMFAPQIGSIEWNYVATRQTGIYAFVLAEDGANPFAPRNDEAKPAKDDTDQERENGDEEQEVTVRIDFDGLQQRLVRVPVDPANIEGLTVTPTNIVYLDSRSYYYGREPAVKPKLIAFSIEDREPFTVAEDVDDYAISADGSRAVVRSGEKFQRYEIKKDADEPDDVSLAHLETQRVPSAEWAKIFDEVWRRYRDYFYVENMHGYDWQALREKYRPLVDYVSDRAALNYVLGQMIAELSVSHAYVAGGDMQLPERPNTALLGARLALDTASGRYRFSEIFAGQNAEPKYRSPLTEVGEDVDVGDYLLAINGRDLAAPTNPYELLVGAADGLVELTVAESAAGAGARSVLIEPLSSEDDLLYLKWTQQNRDRVDEATNGRVGYLHIPDMSDDGIYEFIKWYYGQIRKDGLIIDVRGNGGGNVSEMLIDRLRRELIFLEYARNIDNTGTYPATVFTGPMAAILDGNTASDGDIFAAAFKTEHLGPVIGKRSWGGVIGITDLGPLLDGGTVYVPEFGHADASGHWTIEGRGVEPDIEVDNPPEAVLNGDDPQLDRAIEEVMRAIEAEPSTGLPPRPAPPVKVPEPSE
jgi:tricorn protease